LWKVISPQLKGYTSTEWQFHVAHRLNFTFSCTTSCPFITYPFLGFLAFNSNSQT
jgi:hypothetical protein